MSKKPGPTSDELLAQFDNLSTAAATTTRAPKSSKPRTPAGGAAAPGKTSQTENDLLKDLGDLAARPASRPGTPSLKANPSTGASRSPARSSTATPPPGRSSEEKNATGAGAGFQRKSGDSARSTQPAYTPATTATEDSPEPEHAAPAQSGGGGGWWGGFLSTATAAVSQAQKAVQDIQKNEDAQKYFEQVRGNVGVIRGFGGDLRSMAMPTFQNILQTIAPPISQHERLQIHITHDFTNYPTLDPLIYQVFSRVMSQVEGGDLMVVQKGQEATARRGSGERSRDFGSWHDGPWWRSGEQRSINAVKGIVEGSKLARVSAESYASEHMAGRGGVEEVAKKATETLKTSNPTRDSEIFMAIQAISQTRPEGLFAGGAVKEEESQVKESPDSKTSEEVLFAIYLHDPVHGIAFQALSQAVPAQWLEWLDAPSGGEGTLPEVIEEIVGSGGVDPREWVSEWVEEALNLAIGVVAQRYVARRMGVGEGGARKGKDVLRANLQEEEVINAGGGEASRALGGM